MCSSVHPLHFSQDLALVHGQHRGILQNLLKHRAALKLIACLLEVVPEETSEQREGFVVRGDEGMQLIYFIILACPCRTEASVPPLQQTDPDPHGSAAELNSMGLTVTVFFWLLTANYCILWGVLNSVVISF